MGKKKGGRCNLHLGKDSDGSQMRKQGAAIFSKVFEKEPGEKRRKIRL